MLSSFSVTIRIYTLQAGAYLCFEHRLVSTASCEVKSRSKVSFGLEIVHLSWNPWMQTQWESRAAAHNRAREVPFAEKEWILPHTESISVKSQAFKPVNMSYFCVKNTVPDHFQVSLLGKKKAKSFKISLHGKHLPPSLLI